MRTSSSNVSRLPTKATAVSLTRGDDGSRSEADGDDFEDGDGESDPRSRSGRSLDRTSDYRGNSLPRVRSDGGRAVASIDDMILLPQRRRHWIGPTILFILIVIAPLGGLYYALTHLASPRYVAEFRFSVTEVTPSSGSLPPATSTDASQGLASLASSLAGGAGGSSASSASPQNFVVVDYLQSRQVVDDLTARINLPALYSRPDIDWWSRLRPNASPEELTDYWKSFISANYDPMSGLATAQIVGFRRDDTLRIANELVELSEDLVNSIEGRSDADAVKFAQNEVTRAEDHLNVVRKKLADFRTTEGVIDPTSGVVPANVTLAATLATTLAQAETTLDTMRKQNLDTNSLLFQKQVAAVKATRDQLDATEREVAKTRDGKAVLTRVVSQYEALDLDRQYAQALLLNAYQSLDRARASAAAQHLYLTPYVRPALPGSATGLKPWRYLAVAAAILIAIWLALVLSYQAIRNGLAAT